MPEIEDLTCFGGPLDGNTMSSVGYPEMQPWGEEGYYIRTPAALVPPIYRKSPEGFDDPLLRLVNDVWVWRQVRMPPDDVALYNRGGDL
jgi:hypothetical protein